MQDLRKLIVAKPNGWTKNVRKQVSDELSGTEKLKNVPTSLNESLNEDLFVLLGEHFTLWEWLRMRDFANLNYGFSAGLIP